MGLIESPAALMVALGGLLASVLVSALGSQAALVVSGAILPLSAVVVLPSLGGAERQAMGHEELSRLLRADPLLSCSRCRWSRSSPRCCGRSLCRRRGPDPRG